jgi:hypothetical protein
VFQGLGPDAGTAARWGAAPNLPDDPSPEHVDAWVELAELVGDKHFRQRIRWVTGYGVQAEAGLGLLEVGRAQEQAEAALRQGVPPDSGEAAQVVNRILAGTVGSHHRAEVLAQLSVVVDSRVGRYWQLTAVINGPRSLSHACLRVVGRGAARL